MTTFGISGNLIPPLFPKSDRLDGLTLNDFRAQINQFGNALANTQRAGSAAGIHATTDGGGARHERHRY